MTQTEFDPYSQRLARDIRNTMGHWFVHGLMDGDPDPAGLALARLEMKSLPQSHRQWVEGQMDIYRRFAENNPAAAQASPLDLGLDLWRWGLFFEAHEALERAWQSAEGDRRLAFKALVQAVGSCIHARRGAFGPAASLAAKAADGLARYGHSLPEVAWLPRLARELENNGPIDIGNFAWSTSDDQPRPQST